MENFNFEKLNVYKESLIFVNYVYSLTIKWPKTETFSLTDQLRRASTSITLNIAEGSSRTKKDFQHFLTTSRGSVYECVSIIKIAKNQKYVNESEYVNVYQQCLKLAKMLTALKNSL